MNEIRQSARALVRTPGFTLSAIAVLALGIGSTAALFSFVDAVLLRPLPYRDPSRVVMVWEMQRDRAAHSAGGAAWQDPGQSMVAAANLADWKRARHMFQSLDAVAFGWFGLSAEEILGGRAETGFFDTLGVQAALGRTFGPGDEGRHVAVLSDALWRRLFGGDRNIIGRQVKLDREQPPYTIIGVLPRDFFFYLRDFSVWVPLELTPAQRTNRNARMLLAVGRLQRGISLGSAQAAMDSMAAGLARAYPATNRDWGATIVPVKRQFRVFLGSILTALFAGVGILLLIACVNIANLSAARAMGRRREIALRLALGATRTRLFRLFGAESLLLVGAGASGGLLLARASLPYLIGLLPIKLGLPIPVPGVENIAINGRVILFTALVSVVTAGCFGVTLALRASAGNLDQALKESSNAHSSGRGAGRFLHALVAAQLALATLLLAGAGVTIKSIWLLFHIDQGFRASGVLTFRTPLARSRYPDAEQQARAYTRYLSEVEKLPGVISAAVAYNTPLGGDNEEVPFAIEGQAELPVYAMPRARLNLVGPNYFRTLAIPMRTGREFTPADTAQATPVGILSESLARKYWPGGDALGRRVRIGDSPEAPWVQIVGVAGDVRAWASAPPSPLLYRPYQQQTRGAMGYVVRSALDLSATGSAIRDAVRSIDPEQPVTFLRPITEDFLDQVYPQRLSAIGLGFFACLALMLAAVGVFSVTSFSVKRRTREFAIRMALGAEPGQILRGLLARTGRVAILGGALGLGAAFAANRVLIGILYHVPPADPIAFGLAAGLLASVAMLACWLAGRDATRTDPARALREE